MSASIPVPVPAPEFPGGYRLRPEHYQPRRVPAEVLRHAGTPEMLPVGSPGKVGVLQLRFERTGPRTELVSHYQKSPLQIMRPLYFDPERPDMPHTYLMSTGGGIVQGDRLRTDLEFGPETSAHITTQAQTRVYRSDTDYASAIMNLTVEASAFVEYLPDPVVPFAGSRFTQQTSVVLDETATLVIGEQVYAGRLAYNERHDYEVFASDFEVRRPGGRIVALDRVRLCPDRRGVGGTAVLADHDILISLYVFTPLVPPPEIAECLRTVLDGMVDDDLVFGVSALPGDAGAWMRLVGNDPVAVARAWSATSAAVHELLTGRRAPKSRKT